MKFTVLIILFAHSLWAQTYSKFLTDREVEEFLTWEMKEPSNNQSEFFSISNTRLKTLKKTNDWEVKYIVFNVDSIDYTDFFHETFKGVNLNYFLSGTDIDFLRTQFEERMTNVEFNESINPDNFVRRVKSNQLIVIYSVPLVSRDKSIFVLLKEYTWGNSNRGECVINIYKKLDNGWTLSKAQSVSEY